MLQQNGSSHISIDKASYELWFSLNRENDRSYYQIQKRYDLSSVHVGLEARPTKQERGWAS